MRIISCLLTLLVIMSFNAVAQDQIIKRNGDVIEAKIKSVGTTTIIYNRFDNLDGPEYTILKREVKEIKYKSGSTDSFEGVHGRSRSGRGAKEDKDDKKQRFKYGDNIISIMPGVLTTSLDVKPGEGIGVCYERALDKKGHIGLVLPVLLNFTSGYDNYNYYGSGTNQSSSFSSVIFMPGLKFYPAPSTYRVRYSLGASLFVMSGNEPYGFYENNGGYQYSTTQDTWHYLVYGFMISNSLNVSFSKKVYGALDLGSAIPIIDNRLYYRDIPVPILQFGLKVGYRF